MEHVTAVQMEQHLRSCGFEVRASDYGNAWEIEVLNQRQVRCLVTDPAASWRTRGPTLIASLWLQCSFPPSPGFWEK